jgi:hypothetical protein
MPNQKMAKRAAKIADLQEQIATLKAAHDEIEAIKLKIKQVKAKTKK